MNRHYIASCLTSEKLYKYQIREIKDMLEGICSFDIANGNNPFFDCSLRGDVNKAFKVAKYVSQFRPVIWAGGNARGCYLLWKGKFVAGA
jgi:hypothetical protein